MDVEEELYQRIWANQNSDGSINVDPGSRVALALKLLDSGDRFLDIGCGAGTLCHAVKDRFKDIYGVDISENALDIAKKYCTNTSKVNLNVERLPFEDGYFDAVACLDVIEHLFDPVCLLEEIGRVLKNDGVLVISAPNIRYWRHLSSLVIKGRFPKTSSDSRHYDGGHLHYFTFKDLDEMLKYHGFSTVKRRGVFGRDMFMEILSPGIVIKSVKL